MRNQSRIYILLFGLQRNIQSISNAIFEASNYIYGRKKIEFRNWIAGNCDEFYYVILLLLVVLD